MKRRQFIHKSLAGSSLALASLYVSPLLGNSLSMAAFKLPDLPYDYAALEPHFDKQTMEIHHSRHHEGYIKNLNKEVDAKPELAKMSLEEILKNVSKYNTAVRNNAGGHFNHDLFWQILSPKKTSPSGTLLKAIESEFNSLENFKEKFETEATKRFGSGWAWLINSNGKLKITSTPNQDNPLMDVAEEKGVPLLGLDVWEHAYYLKYQNKRADYAKAFWNVVNWDEVSKRFQGKDKK